MLHATAMNFDLESSTAIPIPSSISRVCQLCLWICIGSVGSGCGAGDGLRDTVLDFQGIQANEMSKISLEPIYVGSNLLTLNKEVETNDRELIRRMREELTFVQAPGLPGDMQHSASVGACRAVVSVRGEERFCILIILRKGASGGGIEYAMSPTMDLNSVFDERLPGNHVLGRGYSVGLLDLVNDIVGRGDAVWGREVMSGVKLSTQP